MVKLIVEGFEIELSEDMAADITYSLADIRTPEKRQVNFTKTLNINGTAKNNYSFGFIYDVDVSNPNTPTLPNIGVNYNPKKLAKVQMYDNSVKIFDGALRLWKVVSNKGILTYEVSLFGKLFDIFSAMGDLKLTDLDYSDLNHVISWTDIQDNWSASSAYYRYPLVDFGYNEQDADGKPSTFKFGSLIPSLYHKVYLDKIFSSIGAQYVLNFSNLDVYNKLLVVPSIPKISVRPDYLQTSYTAPDGEESFYNDGESPVSIDWDDMFIASSVDHIAPGLTYDIITNRLTFDNPVESSFQYKIQAVVDIYLNPGNVGGCVFSVILYNPGGGYVGVVAQGGMQANDSGTVQEVTIEVPRQLFTTGQYLSVNLMLEPFTAVTVKAGATIRGVSPIDSSEYPIPSGYVYEMINSVPTEIKQQDFIKDFIKVLNLFVTTDPDDPKTYIFTPQVDFYSRLKSNAIDWSYKIDYDGKIEITPISQLTAKEYLLTWKQDKDYWCALYETNFKQIYGQVIASSDTDIIGNTEKIESIFSPGVLVRFQNSSVICPAIYKIENKEGVDTKKPDKFNARLMLWGGLLASGHNIDLLDISGGVEDTITSYPYAGHLDNPITPTFDLNFGPTNTDLPAAVDSTFIRYWFRPLFEIFSKDGKLISCMMLLRSEDIEHLDFAALYRVNNQYYRLNKVGGFNPFDIQTSEVELIKVVTL